MFKLFWGFFVFLFRTTPICTWWWSTFQGERCSHTYDELEGSGEYHFAKVINVLHITYAKSSCAMPLWCNHLFPALLIQEQTLIGFWDCIFFFLFVFFWLWTPLSLPPFQWTTRTVLCCPNSADIWVPPFTRSHIQRSETREPSHWPPRLHSGEPERNELICNALLCLTCPHFAHVWYTCSCFLGDRLWICQEGKRQDLDVVWDTRVPGARDHPQQSMEFLGGFCFRWTNVHCQHTNVRVFTFLSLQWNKKSTLKLLF